MKIKNQGDNQRFSQLYDGDLLAQYFYINDLINDFCINKNKYTAIEASDFYADAQDWWSDIMDKRFAPALCIIGKLHEFGIGTAVDKGRAMECYKTASQMYVDNNNPHPIEALRYLALVMETSGDHAMAVRLFSLGAPVDGSCCYYLGKIMYQSTINSGYHVNSMNKTQRERLAISVLQDGCNKGNVDCMDLLSQLYKDGLCGLPMDINQALYYAQMRVQSLKDLVNTTTGKTKEENKKSLSDAEKVVQQLKIKGAGSSYQYTTQNQTYVTPKYQEKSNKKSNINWGVAILLSIISWPIGLIYILVKMRKK